MSIEAMNWVWKNTDTKGSERLVLLALADNANDEGEAWPSLTTLASKCNMSRRYIIKILDSLEVQGLITKTVRRRQGKQIKNKSNKYRINIDAVVNTDTLPSQQGSELPDTTGSELPDTTVVNPSSPEPSKKDNMNHHNNGRPPIFAIYEQEIGALSSMIADELEDLVETYSFEWVVEAIEIAVKNNVRKLSYVNGILRRWHTEGKGNGARQATELIVKNKDGSFNV